MQIASDKHKTWFDVTVEIVPDLSIPYNQVYKFTTFDKLLDNETDLFCPVWIMFMIYFPAN